LLSSPGKFHFLCSNIQLIFSLNLNYSLVTHFVFPLNSSYHQYSSPISYHFHYNNIFLLPLLYFLKLYDPIPHFYPSYNNSHHPSSPSPFLHLFSLYSILSFHSLISSISVFPITFPYQLLLSLYQHNNIAYLHSFNLFLLHFMYPNSNFY